MEQLDTFPTRRSLTAVLPGAPHSQHKTEQTFCFQSLHIEVTDQKDGVDGK